MPISVNFTTTKPVTNQGSFCSGSGLGSIVEPLAAVPLNDELQQARSLVAKAEEDVLLKLTEKVLKALISVHSSFIFFLYVAFGCVISQILQTLSEFGRPK